MRPVTPMRVEVGPPVVARRQVGQLPEPVLVVGLAPGRGWRTWVQCALRHPGLQGHDAVGVLGRHPGPQRSQHAPPRARGRPPAATRTSPPGSSRGPACPARSATCPARSGVESRLSWCTAPPSGEPTPSPFEPAEQGRQLGGRRPGRRPARTGPRSDPVPTRSISSVSMKALNSSAIRPALVPGSGCCADRSSMMALSCSWAVSCRSVNEANSALSAGISKVSSHRPSQCR